MTERTGQCLCGAVQFKLTSEPLAARVCWCRDCQHISGNGTANMMVAASGLEVTGALAQFTKAADSGNAITREFCPVCGTQLFASSSARPLFRVVRIGNLENPSDVSPTSNIWIDSAPEWACLNAALEQVHQQPAPPQAPVAVKG